jgi:hypothetical protein
MVTCKTKEILAALTVLDARIDPEKKAFLVGIVENDEAFFGRLEIHGSKVCIFARYSVRKRRIRVPGVVFNLKLDNLVIGGPPVTIMDGYYRFFCQAQRMAY